MDKVNYMRLAVLGLESDFRAAFGKPSSPELFNKYNVPHIKKKKKKGYKTS